MILGQTEVKVWVVGESACVPCNYMFLKMLYMHTSIVEGLDGPITPCFGV